MVEPEAVAAMLQLKQLGGSKRIARELGVNRRTVKTLSRNRWLAEAQAPEAPGRPRELATRSFAQASRQC